MRNIDGLLPQDAFHELIKILFVLVRIPGNKRLSAKEDWNSALRRELSRTKINGKEAFIKEGFTLSEKALISVVDLFSEIDFRNLDIDVKSAAISAFVKPETRRGLGLFLTPDQVADYVVRTCIDYFVSLNNHSPNIVLDVAYRNVRQSTRQKHRPPFGMKINQGTFHLIRIPVPCEQAHLTITSWSMASAD